MEANLLDSELKIAYVDTSLSHMKWFWRNTLSKKKWAHSAGRSEVAKTSETSVIMSRHLNY